jgi:hypothetical protein
MVARIDYKKLLQGPPTFDAALIAYIAPRESLEKLLGEKSKVLNLPEDKDNIQIVLEELQDVLGSLILEKADPKEAIQAVLSLSLLHRTTLLRNMTEDSRIALLEYADDTTGKQVEADLKRLERFADARDEDEVIPFTDIIREFDWSKTANICTMIGKMTSKSQEEVEHTEGDMVEDSSHSDNGRDGRRSEDINDAGGDAEERQKVVEGQETVEHGTTTPEEAKKLGPRIPGRLGRLGSPT